MIPGRYSRPTSALVRADKVNWPWGPGEKSTRKKVWSENHYVKKNNSPLFRIHLLLHASLAALTLSIKIQCIESCMWDMWHCTKILARQLSQRMLILSLTRESIVFSTAPFRFHHCWNFRPIRGTFSRAVGRQDDQIHFRPHKVKLASRKTHPFSLGVFLGPTFAATVLEH